VATKFHKKLIINYFKDEAINRKIHVVGFPMDWKKETAIKKNSVFVKENIVVFPHRTDKEKQPEVFETIMAKIKNFKGIITMNVTKNKQDYYKLLSKSKYCFSANLQETFGIGTVEAMMFDSIPIVPNRLSYLELYHKQFRYTKLSEVPKMIERIENNKSQYSKLLRNDRSKIINKSLNAIKIMWGIMKCQKK